MSGKHPQTDTKMTIDDLDVSNSRTKNKDRYGYSAFSTAAHKDNN